MRALLPALLCLPVLLAQGPVASPAGDWAGSIHLPTGGLLVEVHLEAGLPWSGRISIPLQGLRNLPLERVIQVGDRISFQIPRIPGTPTFEGKLGPGGISGSFRQGGAQFPFELKPQAVPEPLPAGLLERAVSVGAAPYLLPGVLTLPTGQGPWPLLVLVHGSGPGDRDESIGPSRPFRDLAWGLGRLGVAVLRYDKRVLVYPAGSAPDMNRFTVAEEAVDDAKLAVALARGFAEVDPKRVFVLGHSLGGYLVPRIAKAAPEAAGFVLWAGSARPTEDLLLEQVRRNGAPAAVVQQVASQVARIKALNPQQPAKEFLLNAPAAYWLDLRGYDPAREARAIAKPMLVLQGDNDCQVTQTDFALWQSALQGRTEVRLKRYPGLNHLFMPVPGVSTGAEYTEPGQHVAPEVIADLAAWIKGLPAR